MKSKYILWIPAVVAVVAVTVLLIQAFTPEEEMYTGMVEATTIDVASKIPGRMDSVFVREGDAVRKGQALGRLQSKEIDAKVEQARGALQAAKAKLNMALNGARPEERQAVKNLYLQARHQFDLAEKTYRRVQSVYQDSVISEQERDQVEFKYKAAKEQLEAAKAKYEMVKKGARKEQVEAARGLVHQAENAVQEALSYQQETLIKSPIDGELSKRLLDAGEITAAGYPVFTVLDTADVWVTLQLREDQLAHIRKGQTVKGTIPALSNKQVSFRVSHFASMADFATWRATNQKGDFDLKTFEVRLRPEAVVKGLRPGMTVRIAF